MSKRTTQAIEALPLTPGTDPVFVGQVRELVFRPTGGSVTIPVLVVKDRTVFGRKEWMVSPVLGQGTAWVTETGLITEGVPVRETETPKS